MDSEKMDHEDTEIAKVTKMIGSREARSHSFAPSHFLRAFVVNLPGFLP